MYPACHNGQDSVTITGDVEKITSFVQILEKEGVFAKTVNSSGVPFHSPAMQNLRADLLDNFKMVSTLSDLLDS